MKECNCKCHSEVYWTTDTVLDLAKAFLVWSKQSKNSSIRKFVEMFQPLAHPTKTKNAVSAQIYKLKKEGSIQLFQQDGQEIWQPTEELAKEISSVKSAKRKAHPWYIRLLKVIQNVFC